MSLPASLVTSSVGGPVLLPALVKAVIVTRWIVAGSRSAMVTSNVIAGSCTCMDSIIMFPMGASRPSVCVGVAMMSYDVIRPLGEVGVSHVTVNEDEVLVTNDTRPMPVGTVCVCVCVFMCMCVCACD